METPRVTLTWPEPDVKVPKKPKKKKSTKKEPPYDDDEVCLFVGQCHNMTLAFLVVIKQIQ